VSFSKEGSGLTVAAAVPPEARGAAGAVLARLLPLYRQTGVPPGSTTEGARMSFAVSRLAAFALAGCLAAAAEAAQELPQTTLKIVGYVANTTLYKDLEAPFFKDELPKLSGGKVVADLKPMDQLGLKGTEVLRLLKNGSLEYVSGAISYMAPDSPKFEAIDLAGVTLDLEKTRAAVDAYRPVLDQLTQKLWNTKLLAFGANPPQVFWCRTPVAGIADLKGKKVRVFNQTLSDFVLGVGGTTVTIPFVDVVPALQRGVADCAVTGTLSGNNAKWWEVSSHIYPMTVGWAIMFWAVNLDTWNGYPPAVRDFLTKAFAKFEDNAWANAATATAEGLNCNQSKDPCTLGVKANMTVVPLGPTDMQAHARIMQDYVLARWAERCGADCAKEWNETVGKVVGMQAPAGS